MPVISKFATEISRIPKDERIAYRWGGNADAFDLGFLSVPTRFLRGYARGRTPLSTEEAMFLLVLMTFKWGADDPHPGYALVGRMMGVGARTAGRYASIMSHK